MITNTRWGSGKIFAQIVPFCILVIDFTDLQQNMINIWQQIFIQCHTNSSLEFSYISKWIHPNPKARKPKHQNLLQITNVVSYYMNFDNNCHNCYLMLNKYLSNFFENPFSLQRKYYWFSKFLPKSHYFPNFDCLHSVCR